MLSPCESKRHMNKQCTPLCSNLQATLAQRKALKREGGIITLSALEVDLCIDTDAAAQR